MITIVGGRKVTLSKDTVIAQGGEAVIHKDPDHPLSRALKIYHEPTEERAQKLRDFISRQFQLPESVVPPLELVFDSRGDRVIGFQMKRLGSRFWPIARMFEPSFCRDHGLTTRVKAEFFSAAGLDLAAIHAAGLVVGDYNAGNQMFDQARFEGAFLDTDSWQFGPYPCPVATVLYLCPDLYGIDLSKKPLFEPRHDWWAFVVILIRALLLGVHPFKSGMHKKWHSVADRAENGVTVFDKAVTYPNIGLSPEVMTDELLDMLIKVLKRQFRAPFPLDVLREYAAVLVECKSCGLWYPSSRGACPACSAKTFLDFATQQKMVGLLVEKLIATTGRILRSGRDAGNVYAVAEEKGRLVFYRKSFGVAVSRVELGVDHAPGSVFGFFSGLLAVCPDPNEDEPRVFVLDVSETATKLVQETSTVALEGGRAVWACSARFLYRIAERTLLCAERFSESGLMERPVTQVTKGQTWFTACADPDLEHEYLFGFQRDFAKLNWFMVRGDESGRQFTRLSAVLDQHESLLDFSVKFSEKAILLVRKTRKFGVEFLRLDLVSTEDGKAQKNICTQSWDAELWDNIHGKAFDGSLVIHATPGGLVRENLLQGRRSDLSGSDQLVGARDLLTRTKKGVLVVNENTVVTIDPQ